MEEKTTMMDLSVSEIVKHLADRLMEEITDSNTYCDMGVAAQRDGDQEMAMALYTIGHEEFTHAKFIHDTLVAYGHPIDDATMNAWCALEERDAKWW